MVLSGTDLVTQDGLDAAGVNLDLSVEDVGEVGKGTTSTRNAEEAPVEDFNLSFGNR